MIRPGVPASTMIRAARSAGVVDEDVEAAQPVGERGDGVRRVAESRDVEMGGRGARALLLDPADGLLGPLAGKAETGPGGRSSAPTSSAGACNSVSSRDRSAPRSTSGRSRPLLRR